MTLVYCNVGFFIMVRHSCRILQGGLWTWSPPPYATQMVRRASPSPKSRAQTWQASQDAAAVPKEDIGKEDSDNRSILQALLNKLLLHPPPLLPDLRRRQLSLTLSSGLLLPTPTRKYPTGWCSSSSCCHNLQCHYSLLLPSHTLQPLLSMMQCQRCCW